MFYNYILAMDALMIACVIIIHPERKLPKRASLEDNLKREYNCF